MAETLPMLEKDPRPALKISRGLRVLTFSLVVALVLVALLIVVVRYLWDNWVIGTPLEVQIEKLPFVGDAGPYNSNPMWVVPAIFVIAALFAKVLWDDAEGRQVRR